MLPTLVALGCLSTPVNAQTIDWASAVDGVWFTAGNWNPANVPDADGETAQLGLSGAYTVTLDYNCSVGGLMIVNAAAAVDIPAGRYLYLTPAQNMVNAGRITVNSGGAAVGTGVRFDASLEIGGGGLLELNAHPDNLTTAVLSGLTGVTLVNAADHAIEGSGQSRINLNNRGLVSANRSGRVLQLYSNPVTNEGLMQAVSGGILQVTNADLTQVGGVVRADGGMVEISSATISGGDLEAINAGTVESPGGVTTISSGCISPGR